MGKYCQSCGMPLKQDPEQGGSEADGSKNSLYCSHCYRQGAFTQPDLTLAQMQAFCIDRLKENGLPRLVAWLLARQIPKLKRWQ